MENAGPVSTLRKFNQHFGGKQEGFVIYFTKFLASAITCLDTETGLNLNAIRSPCTRKGIKNLDYEPLTK
jgi:hypothetical protein